MLSVLDAEPGTNSLYVSSSYWNTKDPQRPTIGRAVSAAVGQRQATFKMGIFAPGDAAPHAFSTSCEHPRGGGRGLDRCSRERRSPGRVRRQVLGDDAAGHVGGLDAPLRRV